MDVNSVFEAGGVLIPNPNYTKSKKNTQPEYIVASDLESGVTGNTSAMAGISYSSMKEGLQGKVGPYEDYKKYIDYGIAVNRNSDINDLDRQLAEEQSAWTKWGNALAQTVVSEIGLGFFKGVSDLIDIIGQATTLVEPGYSNPVSQFLEEKQEEFRNFAPIYTTPGINISNGGLLDAGWYASNFPSVASSLTLLLPSAGAVKGIGAVAKAFHLGSYSRRTIRAITGAKHKLEEAQRLRSLGESAKVIEEATKFNKFQKFMNSTSTRSTANLFLENTSTALLSRSIENYQEARQTYNDMYVEASEELNKMNDEEYFNFLVRNQNILRNPNIDIENRDEVAKHIAKVSADRTFQIDWMNVGWDVLQMYGIQSAWKGMSKGITTKAKIRRANLDAAKYSDKINATSRIDYQNQLKALKKSRKFKEKTKEWFEDRAYGSWTITAAEASEGAEEALNYIATQEGMHLGNVLLGKEEGDPNQSTGILSAWSSVFDNRFTQYVKDPGLWDSAFWGVAGGVIFQSVGSSLRRVKNTLENKSFKKDKEGNESAKKDAQKENLPWWHLNELPETERRITEIQDRAYKFSLLKENLDKINNNIDIYHSTDEQQVEFTSPVEKEIARKKLFDEFIVDVTLNAANSSNIDLLKAYMANDNIRKAIVEKGVFKTADETRSNDEIISDSKNYADNILRKIEEVEDMYNREIEELDMASSRIKFKDNEVIPAEYLQIMASNNVRYKIGASQLQRDLAFVNSQILELKNNDKLDQNIDYESAVRVATLSHQLGSLRVQRKQLQKEAKEGSLSAQISISNIDKQIKAIEDKLDDAELIYATFNSLRYVWDENDKRIKQSVEADSEETLQAFAYRDQQIISNRNKPINIPGLEGLSERALKPVSDETIGKYKTLDQDANKAFKDLSEKAPKLNTALIRKVMLEQDIIEFNSQVVSTTEEVQERIGFLHNTFSEARKKAINKANIGISDLAIKYGVDNIRNVILDAANGTNNFDKSFMSDEDLRDLNNYLKILSLTKAYNKSLIAAIDRSLLIADAIVRSAEDEKRKNSATSENANSDQSTTDMTDSSNQALKSNREQVKGQIEQISVTNPQDLTGRQPIGYVTAKANAINLSTVENGSGSTTFAIYDNGDGTYTIDGRNKPALLNNPKFYFNANSVDLTENVEVVTHPIVKKTSNGKYKIVKQGELANVDKQAADNNKSDKPSAMEIEKAKKVALKEIEDADSLTELNNIINKFNQEYGEDNDVSNAYTTKMTSLTSPTGEVIDVAVPSFGAATNPLYPSVEKRITEIKENKTDEEIIDAISKEFEISSKTAKEFYDHYKLTHEEDKKSKETKDVLINLDLNSQMSIEIPEKIWNAAKENLDVDLDALCNSIADEYSKLGALREDALALANRIASKVKLAIERKKAKEKSMASAIDEIFFTQSSVVNNTFTTKGAKEYIEAVKNLIEQYQKEVGIRKIDGKYYINFEELLRYCNEITNDKETSNFIYSSLVTYLNTENAKKKYVTTDSESTDRADFLKDVQKDRRERYLEKVQNKEVQRADVQTIAKIIERREGEEALKEFYKALDELKVGDVLTPKLVDDRVELQDSKGRTVASLGKVDIDPSTGAHIVYRNGWKYVINYTNSGIDCSLKRLFNSWLFPKNSAQKELNEILYKLAFDKTLTKEDRDNLLEKFANNGEIKLALSRGDATSKVTIEELKDGIVKLWRFVNENAFEKEETFEDISNSLDAWFDKIASSTDAALAVQGNKNIKITVNSLTEGELIKLSENETPLPASEALAGGPNPEIHKIAGGDIRNAGVLVVSGMPVQQFTAMKNQGNTFLLIPHSSGYSQYVNAFPCRVTDDIIGDDAKEIIKAIKTEIHKLLDQLDINPTGENLGKILSFINSVANYKNENKNLLYCKGFNVSTQGNRIVFNIANTNYKFILFKSNQGYIGNKKGNINVSSEEFKKYVDDFIDLFQINFNRDYISSDNHANVQMKGLATKQDGKFIITVGNKTWEYNSFNEFILKNNLVRLGTKPNEEGTSNYSRKASRNQGYDQKLDIRFEDNSSSPVEKKQETTEVKKPIETIETKSIPEQLIDILNSEENIHKGNAIARLFTDNEDLLNSLINLKLLPKNIIFDAELNNDEKNKNKNAVVNVKTKTVTIGTKWTSLFNNPLNREYAIKKLIHEQLHIKLNSRRSKLSEAKAIFKEFEDFLNSGKDTKGYKTWRESEGLTKEEADAQFKQYLYLNKENREEALEEFFVETLTSQELATLLNSIDAEGYEVKKRNTLLQKIMDFMAELFGIEIQEGSLYHKEYNLLRDIFSNKPINNKEEIVSTKQDKEEVKTDSKKSIEVKPDINSNTNSTFGKSNAKRLRKKFDSAIDEISYGNNNTTNYTEEMQSIKEHAIADGTFMKAPNGNPTNLNERQWLQVRTKNFINWFGDWINNPSEASKVVDENGEPLVVYHGSKSIFNVFDSSKSGSRQYLSQQIKPTNFFSSDKTVADFFALTENQSLASKISKSISIVLDAFAGENVDENILYDEIWTDAARRTGKSKEFVKDFWENKVPREYKMHDEFGITRMEDHDIDKYKYNVFLNMKSPIILDAKGERADRFIKANKEVLNNNDEVIIININETVGKEDTATDYLVRNPNQIKSATDNTGEFSTTNDDIYFSEIDEITTNIPSLSSFIDRLPIEQQANFAEMAETGEVLTLCR